jgi:diguanylate cyclase (GGDEF)-like protein
VNLNPRFLLIAALLVVLASLSSWVAFRFVAEGIIEQWGRRLAELQVRYDSARMLKPLEREIALARQMADSNILKQWAANPDNRPLETLALAEMESFRRNFRDRSYFVALLDSGAYYHNNAANDFVGRPLRYHLKPGNPDDAWFYGLLNDGREFHLNINPDVVLGVTKLWIDVLMRDGDRILGVVGTGIELEDFLRDFVDIRQPGITTVFVDLSGAIQLHRNKAIIDHASFIKPEGQKKTIELLFDDPADGGRVRRMMERLAAMAEPEGQVVSDFVTVDGRRHLAGIAYLPGIGWYEITLLDLAVVMPVARFAPVGAVFAITLLLALLLMHLALRRYVLGPVVALERAMIEMREGRLAAERLPAAEGEMGRLVDHFRAMAGAIASHTAELEDRVRERTEALHRLARIDPLTGLVNRRGMTELLAEQVAQASREGAPFGVIWCDLDDFKALNDTRGHVEGDRALREVAQLLRASIRPYDHPGRWGGDEFLVVLSPCDGSTLETIAERIRALVAERLPAAGLPVTLSIGACLAVPFEPLEAILQRADDALYAAKRDGRNRLHLAPAPAGGGKS